MPKKVCELAKELGVPEDDILEQLRHLYVDVEDRNSPVDDKIAGLVRVKLGIAAPPPKKPKKAKPAAAPKTKAKKAGKKTEKDEEVKDEKVKDEALKKSSVKVLEKEGKEKKGPIVLKKEGSAKSAAEEKTKKGIKEVLGLRIVKKAEPVEPEKPKEVKPAEQAGPEELKKAGSPKKKKKSKPVIEVVENLMKPGGFGQKRQMRRGKGKRGGKGGKSASEAGAIETAQPSDRKIPQKIEIHPPINIRGLAPLINKKPNDIIQYLMSADVLANINQSLDEDLVRDVLGYFGFELEIPETIADIEKELVAESHEGSKDAGEMRAPVVTFMGHVDHGKTSLLDYIRNTMVAAKEKGGITQHIGAYRVETAKGAVAFLDTPGHAAFTAMRARGASATDVVVLVVAADDGVMPQTKEAIDHARAAGVPIVVAINKCDLPGANTDRVKKGLQAEGLSTEEWGGDTVMVEVSAKTGEGIEQLVEMLMLESELLELKASPSLRARGVVIEAKKTPGKGIAVTLLVMNGTLRPGDVVFTGTHYGRVKLMTNESGEKVEEALPATPIEMLGLQGVPEAGDEFFVVKNEKKAKTLSLLKQEHTRKQRMAGKSSMSLEDFHSRSLEGDIKDLRIILKADVQGSVEVITHSLEELSTDEVKLSIIHSTVGNINESDIMLAIVSKAVVVGFHVKVEPKAAALAKRDNADLHIYDIIYEVVADIKAAMEGLLEPEEVEVFCGTAQVREIFETRHGRVAGCMVTKGTLHRKDRVRVKRAKEVVFEGSINALKRFKDDVRDVKEGFECGISINGFTTLRKSDIIETFTIDMIARRLEK